MGKEVKVTVAIILVALALGASGLFIKNSVHNGKILSPFGKSFSIGALFKSQTPLKKTVYGYLPYWSLDKVDNIQLDKLTDIAYFGLNIDEKGNFITLDTDGTTLPGYNQWKNSESLDKFIKKAKKHDVNVALTVISHNDDISDKFLDCNSCWVTLANNLETELNSKKIKDVNLNFEYVEYTPEDKAQKYTQLTKYINEEMDKRLGDSKVVVATFADSVVKPRVSDLESIAEVADAIFIMAYDFHRPNSDTAGPVAPIGGKGVYAEYDIETMLQDYLSVASADKLILGVPYYGYNWVVDSNEVYAPRVDGNDYLGYSQSQTYSNIMTTVKELQIKVEWDDLAKSPYFSYVSPETGANRQVFFENVESLSHKYDLVNQLNLKGVGIWALGYDDEFNDLWNLIAKKFY